MRHGPLVLAGLTLLTIALSCRSSTAPCTDAEGRGSTTFDEVVVACSTSSTELICTATADNANELYVYCPLSKDVTQVATWTAADPSIVALIASGHFAAAAPGHTYITAAWQATPFTTLTSYQKPVAVYPGTQPLPTWEISGAVYRAGTTPAAGAIDGAKVTILDGLAAGQTAISGVPPPSLPGYYVATTVNHYFYRLLGIPPGTYHMRVTKDGYTTQDAIVSVGTVGGATRDFPLTPSS